MRLIYEYLFPAMWVVYAVYLWAASMHVKATQRREPALPRLERLLLMVCAVMLLSLPSVRFPLLNEKFLPSGPGRFWCGAAVTVAGLLFSIWARR